MGGEVARAWRPSLGRARLAAEGHPRESERRAGLLQSRDHVALRVELGRAERLDELVVADGHRRHGGAEVGGGVGSGGICGRVVVVGGVGGLVRAFALRDELSGGGAAERGDLALELTHACLSRVAGDERVEYLVAHSKRARRKAVDFLLFLQQVTAGDLDLLFD
eukprot:5690859-Pleurochrysis_carterae.AAC.1